MIPSSSTAPGRPSRLFRYGYNNEWVDLVFTTESSNFNANLKCHPADPEAPESQLKFAHRLFEVSWEKGTIMKIGQSWDGKCHRK
jgi:hypothetical protein